MANQSIDDMVKEHGCVDLTELLVLMLEQSKKDREAFKLKPRREQLEIELERASRDYNSCMMVGNYEGIVECREDMHRFSAELAALDKEENK